MVELGSSYNQLIEMLGKPQGEAMSGSTRVVMYKSPSMTLADVYRLENDQLVMQSLSFYKEPKVMDEYVIRLGTPEYSVRKYAADTPDSLRTVVHVWPKAGRAVTTTGESYGSVIREDTFAPMELQSYLMTWGKDLVGHEQVVRAASQSESVDVRSSNSFFSSAVFPLGVILLLVVIVLFVWRQRIRQSRKAH